MLDYFLSFTPGRYAYMPVMLRLDAPVFVFAFGASLLTVVLFGLAPALNASRSDLSVSLKEGGERGSSSGGGPRLRSALVVFQIALSLSLLVCSALFVERFGLLMQTDAGFRIENLLTTSVNLPLQRYPEARALAAVPTRPARAPGYTSWCKKRGHSDLDTVRLRR